MALFIQVLVFNFLRLDGFQLEYLIFLSLYLIPFWFNSFLSGTNL